jgi:hypothetical protein
MALFGWTSLATRLIVVADKLSSQLLRLVGNAASAHKRRVHSGPESLTWQRSKFHSAMFLPRRYTVQASVQVA